jgi:hypothetical protein
MNRFSDEIRIISPVAWIIALLLEAGMFSMLLFVAMPGDPKLSKWPYAGQVAFSIWPGLLLMVMVLLIGYVNADARRRGMRYVMWTLLAIFIPNAIGIILYFVLRDPPLVPCPRCGHLAAAGFVFCTQCGADLLTTCPSCKRAVKAEWKRCAYCGTELVSRQTPPPAPIIKS